MMRWIKGFFKGLKEEIFMKTKYPNDGSEVDTFFRWLVSVIFFVIGYLLIYLIDEKPPAVEEWLNQNFGWDSYDPTPPAKIAWHRLTAGLLFGGGIFFCTMIYLRHLYFRIKARIAKSKAEAQDS
jgi:hypothetical protein